MLRRESKWNVKAIILMALIGIIMGVIYTYVVNPIYNSVELALNLVGLGPLAGQICAVLVHGCALAMYFVPTFGSGIVGETLAATVEMAFGGQWGQ